MESLPRFTGYEILAIFEEAPFVHRYISGDLFHPGFIGMWRDPGDFNATALQMDEEEHIVSDQPTQRQYFHCEKVGTRQDRHVRADEVCPGCCILTLWCGQDTVGLENIAYHLVG